MAIKFITNNNYKSEIKPKGTTLVAFFATWCGPCQMFGDVLEELDKEGNVKIVKVDVDKNQEAAKNAGVSGIPATYVFKDGKETNNFSGYLPLEALKEKI